MTRITDIHGDL